MDDHEVYLNVKNGHPPMTAEQKAAKKEWEEAHPGEKYTMNWNFSLDYIAGDSDEPDVDKSNVLAEALFENFAEGILDEAEYQFAKKKYDEEAKEIEKKLTVEKAKKVQLDDILSLSNEWLVAIYKAENITEIDAGLVKHLVSSVKIFENNRVEVELNFRDQRNIFNRIIAEMAGEANE